MRIFSQNLAWLIKNFVKLLEIFDIKFFLSDSLFLRNFVYIRVMSYICVRKRDCVSQFECGEKKNILGEHND